MDAITDSLLTSNASVRQVPQERDPQQGNRFQGDFPLEQVLQIRAIAQLAKGLLNFLGTVFFDH